LEEVFETLVSYAVSYAVSYECAVGSKCSLDYEKLTIHIVHKASFPSDRRVPVTGEAIRGSLLRLEAWLESEADSAHGWGMEREWLTRIDGE
jgi:hypothetical protein